MIFRIILRRIFFLLVIIWVASTIIFFIPRLSTRNPIRQKFNEMAMSGGFAPGDTEKIVAAYEEKFGLNKPLWQQYLVYIGGLAHGDLGVSIFKYPATVVELIQQTLPWTISLLLVTTILSFLIGNLLGAVAAWPRSPGWLRSIATPFIILQGVPPVLMGVLLLFFIGFKLKLLPQGSAYSIGLVPDWNSFVFWIDVLKHQILPGLALILGQVGGWVLSMRGMGITIQGEDYVNFAEHKGLNAGTIFKDYYLRNTVLPQVTGLALALGTVVTSGLLVEQIFGLPGIGQTLATAIQNNDFLVIYGIVIFITVAIATMLVAAEFLYPLIDPRIRLE